MGVGSLEILAGVLVLRAARGDRRACQRHRRACQRPWRLSCELCSSARGVYVLCFVW